jgi:RNA polymerase sigma factor (sigma-70 family)
MNRSDQRTTGHESSYSDAELVALARSEGGCWAAQELILRHLEDVRELVARLAQTAGLQPRDVENAQQDAFFAMRRAVLRYDLGNPSRPFRCFLRRVVRNRFQDFLRRWWRRRRRVFFMGDVLPGTEGCAAAPEWLAVPIGGQDEPHHAVQWREARAALDRAVGALDERERWHWEEWCRGTPADVLARQLGCCPHSVRRQRSKLLATLRAQLGSKY